MPDNNTQQFDQSQYFKSVNPDTKMTDIFQNVNGTPTYINADQGKTLFAQGLNADLLSTKPYPNLTNPNAGTGNGNFNLDIPNVIDVSKIKDAFSAGITQNDITSYLDTLKAREADVAKTLVPTEREQALQQQLAGVVSGVEKAGSDLQARPGIDFFTLDRGKSELQRQNELTVANLQRNIQIEQTTRGQASDAAKFLLESAQTGFDTLVKANDAILNRASTLMNVVGQLNTQSQNAFNSILTNLGGLTWDKLDQATKDRVSRLAANLGIPEGVIKQGLQIQADKMNNDREAQLFNMDIQKQQLAIQKYNAETSRIDKVGSGGGLVGFGGSGTGGGKGGAGGTKDAVGNSLDDAFNYVSGFLTADQRKAAASSYSKLAQTGDKQSAKEFLEGLVLNAVPTQQQNEVIGRFQAIAALDDINKSLADYKAAGGNTGIIKGSMEQIANKLGQTTDPKVAKIANEINIAIQAYRHAVSGAAFTESESKQYEGIFPSIGKGGELNQAKIDSLRSAYTRNNRVVVERFVGPGNYQKIWGQPVDNNVPTDEQLLKDYQGFLTGSGSGANNKSGSGAPSNPFSLPSPKPAASSFSFF